MFFARAEVDARKTSFSLTGGIEFDPRAARPLLYY
jgi:hypothetical protein